MWMTGFDAPSCSTIYLDRPMRNHTLMQTIARANRVFPEKENGLIVDYIGVFRDLEKALAIYGAATGDDRRRLADPGQGGARRGARGGDRGVRRALRALRRRPRRAARARRVRVHRAARRRRRGAAGRRRGARRRSSRRRGRRGSCSRPCCPIPWPPRTQATVAVIRVLAERIARPRPRRAARHRRRRRRGRRAARPLGRRRGVRDPRRSRGRRPGPADRPRRRSTSTPWRRGSPVASGPRPSGSPRSCASGRSPPRARNPTRHELVERIEELIAEYNAGSLNIDEYLRRLIALSRDLSEEEQRAVAEGLTEEELAIFDLLTKPDPALTDEEREQVQGRRASACSTHVHEKLVLDWRRKAETMADVRVVDPRRPRRAPRRAVSARRSTTPRCRLVFDHVSHRLRRRRRAASTTSRQPASHGRRRRADAPSIDEITEAVVERIRARRRVRGARRRAAPRRKRRPSRRPIDELIDNDEDDAVEFKSTARWDLREERAQARRWRTPIVKTVAGFLNTDGGTLLIGVGPDGSLVGLELDYPHVKPHERRRLRQLADDAPRQRARRRRGDADPRADRRP